jgi:hypothetical protein
MGKIEENWWPFNTVGGLQGGVVNPTPVPSTPMMPAPEALITQVSGSAAITTIQLPWTGFTGIIILAGATGSSATLATGGTAVGPNLPIATAGSIPAGGAQMLYSDGKQWYPVG